MNMELPQWAEAIGLDRSLRFVQVQKGSGLLSERFRDLAEDLIVEEYEMVAQDLVDMVEYLLKRPPRGSRTLQTQMHEFCTGQVQALENRIEASRSAQEKLLCSIRRDAWQQMDAIVERIFPETRDMLKDLACMAVA